MTNTQTIDEQRSRMAGGTITILGVTIDSKQKNQVLDQIQEKIENNKKFYVVTPYSEMFVMATRDLQYKEILNNAEFAIPDGIVIRASDRYMRLPAKGSRVLQWLQVLLGIVTGVKNKDGKEIETIKGREFFFDLMEMANKKRWTVIFLGDGEESAQRAKRKLETKYSSAIIRAFTGPFLNEHGTPSDEDQKTKEQELIQTINSLTPQLLFIGFGPPKQEKWIHRTLSMVRINCAVGVGGTFDYINGTMPKPPRWMEAHGLEWLWRLLKDPKRIRRMWNAVVIFSTLIIREKNERRMNSSDIVS